MALRVRQLPLRPLAALAALTLLTAALAAPALAAPALEAQPASPATAKIATKKKDNEDDPCKGGGLIPKPPSVECMTQKAVRTIFGMPKDGWVVKPVLERILRIPDFVETPARGVGDAEWLAEAIGFALLLGVVTFAMLHYFAVGLTSQGGSGLLVDGLLRCTGAGLMILAWPFVFRSATAITNAISAALLPDHAIEGSIVAITAAGGALTGGWGALIIGILVTVIFVLLFFGLLLVKIGLLSGLLVAFIGMPIATALWPIPSLSAPASYAVRFCGMVFTLTIVWALCFKAFGAVNTQFVTWGGSNLGFGEKLMLPVIGIGELGALVAVPRHAVTMWNVASPRGTFGSFASFTASNIVTSKLGQLGKSVVDKGRPGGPRQAGGPSRLASFGKGGKDGPGAAGRGGRGGKGTPGGQAPKGGGRGAPVAPVPVGAANGNGNGNNGNGNGRAGRAGAATGRDGLPRAREDDPRGRQRAEGMRRAAMDRRQGQPPGVATVRAAYRQIAAAEGGKFAGPLRTAVSDGRSDRAVVNRMSWAASAPGVGGGMSAAFERVAAASPETRRQALDALQPTAGPPQSPPPRSE